MGWKAPRWRRSAATWSPVKTLWPPCRRELLEETGYTAPQWENLGAYRVDANRGSGMAHFFLARGAQRVAERDADDLEEQQLLELTRAEIELALRQGEFKVLAWAAIMALALQVV